jgi:C-terminal processing protease CtpA/Prc
MKLYFTLLALIIFSHATIAQTLLFPEQQKEDVEFVKKQLFDAHADPFTELNQKRYTQVFDSIKQKIKTPVDVTTFLKLIKPTISWLSDEHAGFDLDTAKFSPEFKNENIFPPFTLKQQGKVFVVDQLLTTNTTLKSGDTISQVNGVSITTLLNRCAHYTTGFPGQRYQTALAQFGYLYVWATDSMTQHFNIRNGRNKGTIINGTDFKIWFKYRITHAGFAQDCAQMISYTRFGDAGYINACSFSTHSDKEADSLKTVINKLFAQAKSDKVKYLFIDVSKNSGGNSKIGDMLINDFYAKPYLGYQCNWRRSDEYLKLIKSWGINDSVYASRPAGSIIHSDAYQITPDAVNPNRFTGKVYVMIGNGTFSSAMMFATIIKDDHIATLIGQTPENGHPDHFGEVYNATLPNSKISIRFGVKEWIRPVGKLPDNNLRPDIIIDPNKSAAEIIKQFAK